MISSHKEAAVNDIWIRFTFLRYSDIEILDTIAINKCMCLPEMAWTNIS